MSSGRCSAPAQFRSFSLPSSSTSFHFVATWKLQGCHPTPPVHGTTRHFADAPAVCKALETSSSAAASQVLHASFSMLARMLGQAAIGAVPALNFPFSSAPAALRQLSQVCRTNTIVHLDGVTLN